MLKDNGKKQTQQAPHPLIILTQVATLKDKAKETVQVVT